jgi:hypothetical protein
MGPGLPEAGVETKCSTTGDPECNFMSSIIEPCLVQKPLTVWGSAMWVRTSDNGEQTILVELYPHRGGYALPPALFILKPERDGQWYEYFAQQFEQMWSSAAPWDPQARSDDLTQPFSAPDWAYACKQLPVHSTLPAGELVGRCSSDLHVRFHAGKNNARVPQHLGAVLDDR